MNALSELVGVCQRIVISLDKLEKRVGKIEIALQVAEIVRQGTSKAIKERFDQIDRG